MFPTEDVIAKIKRLDRKIPGREVAISDDEEDDETPTPPESATVGSAASGDRVHPRPSPFHLKIEIIEDGQSSQKPSPILRRSVTTDVYQGAHQPNNPPNLNSPSCGKCSRDNLDVVLGEESPHSQRRASSYNRRAVSFCDDVGEIGPPLTDLTPATDSSSSSEVRT